MTTPNTLAQNTVFGGYRIDRLLGRGGMGTVYAAEQIEDGRIVAVKVLSTNLATNDDRERFLREGRTAAAINHPNTVYVYRTEEIDGVPAITMELVEGGTLEEKVERLGPLPVVDAIRDTLQIIDGLDAAERVGILHRDIKPANCFVGSSGEVKVGDFGLSRPVDQVDQVRLTQTGLFLGTPVFSSPEQLMGESLDMRSEIYAVGATLYYLLSGKLPYDADNAVRLIAVVLSGTPTALTSYRPDVPPALDAVVMKCLARKRDDRFANYVELREALVACLPVEHVAAPALRRFGAGVVDMWALSALVTPAFAAIGSRLGVNLAEFTSKPTVQTVALQLLVSLPLELAYYGFLEGRLGWSVGKRLTGLRVVREDGGVPGVARGFGRTVFSAFGGILMLLVVWLAPPAVSKVAINVIGFLIPFAFFVRARKANGYLGEHDRFTGTRVVQAQSSARRTAVATSEPDSVPTPTREAERVGPYTVLEPLASAEPVFSAIDTELKRRVWLVRRPVGTAALPARERQSVRTGCLRWIGGRRSDTEAWDAYAAVRGEPIRDRLTRAAEWSDVHGWLRDVVEEIGSREDPAAETAIRSIDHVWIANDGHAMVLPFSIGTARPQHGNSKGLLGELATAVQQADAGLLRREEWPLQARALLQTFATDRLESVREALARAGARTGVMTSRIRATLWAATTIPLVIGIVFTVFAATLSERDKQDEVRMEPLLGYLGRKHPVPDTLAAKRQSVATYVSGHFAKTIVAHRTDTVVSKILSAKEWKRADSVLAAIPVVTAADLQTADRLVDSVWHGVPPGEISRSLAVPLFSGAVLVPAFALFALLAAALVRRGFAMRALNLELITPDGQRAGRLRLLWRQILVWVPWTALAGSVSWIVLGRANAASLGIGALALAITAAMTLSALKTPARGLSEQWSGTRMVPE